MCPVYLKKKKNRGNYWPLQLSEVVIPVEGNNSLTKKLSGKHWEKDVNWGTWESLNPLGLADLEALGKQEVKAEAEL